MSCGDNELSANVKFEFFLDRTPVCNPLYSHIVKDETSSECGIQMEHSYSRDTRPTDKTMATRTILVHKPPPCPSCHSAAQENEIDMNEASMPLLPLPKTDELASREAMDTIASIAAKLKNRNAEDEDWEQFIDKLGWTVYQHTLFAKVTDILALDRLARLTQLGHPQEPILRRASIDKAVQRMRKAFALIHWDVKLTQWIHGLLLDNLPASHLTAYMDILQTLRAKVPASLMNNMLQGRSNDLLEAMMKPPWEPVPESKDRKINPEPIILIVPSGLPGTSSTAKSTRESNWMTLFATMSSNVQRVHVPEDFLPLYAPLADTLERLVTLTRTKLHDLRKEYSVQRQIILVGFNAGSALALQVASLEQNINCVICMGFASSTLRGARGTLDDRLVELQTPVLFVVGQNGTRTSQEQVESLREQMIAPTALVVVGSADDCLQVNYAKRCLEKVTQAMVDSMVIDEVAEFTNNCILNPPSASKRRPVATASATYVILDSPEKPGKLAGVAHNGVGATVSGVRRAQKSPVKGAGRVNKKKLLAAGLAAGLMTNKLSPPKKEYAEKIALTTAGGTTSYEIVTGKASSNKQQDGGFIQINTTNESVGTTTALANALTNALPKWQLARGGGSGGGAQVVHHHPQGTSLMLPVIQKQKISLSHQFTPMRAGEHVLLNSKAGQHNSYSVNAKGKKIFSLHTAEVVETIELDTDEEIINIDGDPVLDGQVVSAGTSVLIEGGGGGGAGAGVVGEDDRTMSLSASDIAGIPMVFQDSDGNIQEPMSGINPPPAPGGPPANASRNNSNIIITGNSIIPRPNKFIYYKPQQPTIISKSSQQYVVLANVDEKRTVTSAPTPAGPGGVVSSKPLIISVESLEKGAPTSTVYHVVSDSDKEE